MAKIPFTVSARTARLIGQENFTNAEGAVIELVKNTYDADAKVCIVFFDNKYSSIPNTIGTGNCSENFRLIKASLMVINGNVLLEVVCKSIK